MDKNKCNYYTCIHCGKTVHKTHKYLHDLKCNDSKLKSKKDKNYNNINNHNYNNNNKYINIKKKNNNSNKNQIIYNYKCEICGIIMNIKEKSDHLFCHELEKSETNEKDQKNEINVDNILNYSFHNDNNDNSNFNESNYNNNVININRNRNERVIFELLNRNNNRNNIVNNNNNNNLNVRRRRRNSMNYNRTEIFNFTISSGSSDSGYNSRSNSSIDSNDDKNDDAHINDIIDKNCVISKIKRTRKLAEDKKKCLICLENFKKGDNIIILPCIHIFHSDCIKNWMKKQLLCPICKNKINNKK